MRENKILDPILHLPYKINIYDHYWFCHPLLRWTKFGLQRIYDYGCTVVVLSLYLFIWWIFCCTGVVLMHLVVLWLYCGCTVVVLIHLVVLWLYCDCTVVVLIHLVDLWLYCRCTNSSGYTLVVLSLY